MKKLIIVAIDVPEDFDACWDEKTGIQAFHDTVVCNALSGTMDSLSGAIKKCKEKGLETEEQFKKDDYYKFIMTKINVVNSCRPVGYIDDDNNPIFSIR